MVEGLYEFTITDVIELPPNIGWLKEVNAEDVPGYLKSCAIMFAVINS